MGIFFTAATSSPLMLLCVGILRLDVYSVSCEPCCKLGVLTAVSYGKGKLIVGDCYRAGLLLLIGYLHLKDLRRSKCVSDKYLRVLVVDDNVYLLAAKLTYDISYTAVLGSYAGAYGIHILIL